MTAWDGKERRMSNTQDHDLIQKIANDTGWIRDWSEKHDIKDDLRFDKVAKDLEFSKKVIYGGLGIVAFIEIFLKVLK